MDDEQKDEKYQQNFLQVEEVLLDNNPELRRRFLSFDVETRDFIRLLAIDSIDKKVLSQSPDRCWWIVFDPHEFMRRMSSLINSEFEERREDEKYG